MAKRYSIKGKPRAWVIRKKDGTFKKWVSRSKSQRADRRRKAKRVVRSGYGHQGDQKRRQRS